MPSTATITAFYSFTANTKARATQVNNNFDVFRGHLLPIDPNTATAINNTYDLGSSEYYYRSLYAKNWNRGVVSATSSASQSGFARAGLSGPGLTTGATHISGSTITIACAGEPIELSFQGGKFGVFWATVGGGTFVVSTLEILRNGSSLTTFDWSQNDDLSNRFDDTRLPPSALRFIDFPGAGTFNYSVRYSLSNTSGSIQFLTFPTSFQAKGVF